MMMTMRSKFGISGFGSVVAVAVGEGAAVGGRGMEVMVAEGTTGGLVAGTDVAQEASKIKRRRQMPKRFIFGVL
jgi:hypothetical protein